MRVIKTYTYVIDPVTAIDLNTVVGNIHEANIRIPMAKIIKYNYESKAANIIGHTFAEGDDYDVRTTAAWNTRAESAKRVYMMITAFAPQRGTEEFNTNVDPSYDILMTRQMSTNA